MSVASLTTALVPAFGLPAGLLHQAGQAAALAVNGVVAAGLAWLLLAWPGFVG